MKLLLTKNNVIEVHERAGQFVFPRLFLDTRIVVVSHGNRLDFPEEKSKSVGSMEAWLDFDDCDEIGFDKENQMLRFTAFKYPEKVQLLSKEILEITQSIKGTLKLFSYEETFILRPFPYRYYDPAHKKLICFSDEFIVTGDLVEVEVSPDFFMYFRNREYAGWAVGHPERYLSDINWDFLGESTDWAQECHFRELMELITEDTIERMEEREEDMLLQLKLFYTKVSGDYHATGSTGSRILAEWILRLEEVFYG